jgi:predicted permease
MADLDLTLVLMFSFFGVLQIYILLSAGFKATLRNKLSPNSIPLINKLIVNFFIPVYSILEVSRMATIANIKIYYILAISTFLALILRLIISTIIGKILKVDVKVNYAYVLMNGFPSLGSLPLIIGKALCYEGCPLYRDPNCKDILGLMLVNYLIFSIIIFIVGFVFMSGGLKNYKIIKERLKYVWYRFLTITNRPDLFPRYLIYKYIKNSEEAKALYDDFIKLNKLEVSEQFEYTYLTDAVNKNKIEEEQTDKRSKSMFNKQKADKKQENEYNEVNKKQLHDVKINYFKNNEVDVELEFAIDSDSKKQINQEIIGKDANNDQDDIMDKKLPKLPSKRVFSIIEPLFQNKRNKKTGSMVKSESVNNALMNEFKSVSVLYKSTSKKQRSFVEEAIVQKRALSLLKAKSQIKSENKKTRYIPIATAPLESQSIIKTKTRYVSKRMQKNEDNVFNIAHKSKLFNLPNFNDQLIEKDIYRRRNSFDKFENIKRQEYYAKLEDLEIENDVFFKDRIAINLYLTSLFNIINDKLSDPKIIKELNIEKEFIASQINDESLPKFITIDALSISKDDLNTLDKIWETFENLIKEENIDIEIQVKFTEINFSFILQKILNPPVVGCLIGLFTGMSGMREILFSNNHYVSNLLQVITITANAFVPFLLVTSGYTMIKAPKYNLNFTLTKFQIITSFILSNVLFPALGVLFLYVLRYCIGGEIENSVVYRFCLYMPFCLPVTPNLILIISVLDRYYAEEYGYCLSKHFMLMIFTTTIQILLYFVIIN